VDQAEEETAIDFFPDLPDDVEEALESKLELDRWFGCGALSAKSESEKAAPPDK
jgi:hypothetical protein